MPSVRIVSTIGPALRVREPRRRHERLVGLAISIAVLMAIVVSAQERHESRLAVTLIARDFPFASYLSAVHAKISERLEPSAIPGKQPVVAFDIERDGRVTALSIEVSSGKRDYDAVVLRAITAAGPFAPLPVEFNAALVHVRLSAEWSRPPSMKP